MRNSIKVFLMASLKTLGHLIIRRHASLKSTVSFAMVQYALADSVVKKTDSSEGWNLP